MTQVTFNELLGAVYGWVWVDFYQHYEWTMLFVSGKRHTECSWTSQGVERGCGSTNTVNCYGEHYGKERRT